MSALEPEVPAAGEEIHLPGPSGQPALLAAGITIALIGVTISLFLVIAGGVLTMAVLLRWVADARREYAELPGDHS